MARRTIPGKKIEEPKYPSRYGSHASMVVIDFGDDVDDVVLKDNGGYYLTTKNKIDTGLVDQRRAALSEFRERKLTEYCDDLGKSLDELLQEAGAEQEAEPEATE